MALHLIPSSADAKEQIQHTEATSEALNTIYPVCNLKQS